MDINTMAGVTLQEAQGGSQIGLKMLDKANDMAGNQAQELLNALPEPAKSADPGVGGKIDVSA